MQKNKELSGDKKVRGRLSDNKLISNYISTFGSEVKSVITLRTRPQTVDACNCDKHAN